MTLMEDLQKAMYDTLTALGYSVFDYRPEEKPMPYLVIGEDSVTSSPTKTKPHFTVLSTIHTFSNTTGSIETKRIMDKIISNINRSMPVSNWKITHDEVLLTSFFEDSLPDVIHGVVQLELQIIKE